MNLCPISISLLFVYFLVTSRISGTNSSQPTGDFSINCGSNAASTARNGRQWLGDEQPRLSSSLQIRGKSTTSTLTSKLAMDDSVPHKTARISRSPFSYSFQVDSGQKIFRLHFNPSPYKGFRGFKDLFTVKSGGFILLGNFSASLTAYALGVNVFAKEFCLNIKPNHQLNITFFPETSQSLEAYAFVNGIEIISVPASLSYFHGSGIGLQAVKESLEYVDGNTALEIIQRRNLKQDAGLSNGDSDSMFPKWATHEVVKNKNRSWKIPVEVGFRYLIRLHFSELGLEVAETGKLRFKVLIDDMIAQTNSDILIARDGKHVVLYRDYIVMMAGLKTDEKRDILISLLSYDELRDGHGILEGYEIVKLSNPDNSLAGSSPLLRHEDAQSKSFLYLLWLLGNKNVIATVVIAIICLVNVIVYKFRCNWETNSSEEEIRPSDRAERLFRHFSLAEIQKATRNFNEGLVVGKGGFGKVYKGLIDEGQETVAVKRLKSCSKQGVREFLTEIETLSELRHINLVALIGYCSERREMILVYEYMPNGTLADHLYKNARHNRNHPSLTWKQRLNICIEAGRGLDYLHTGHKVIHRDVKPSNILLDENFVAKVSDFGLAKPEDRSRLHSHVSTMVKGTFGYIDPYYVTTQKLTKKSDTYSFGVVLLEVLCGRPAVERWLLEEEQILAKWAVDKITIGEEDQIVALNLREEILPSSLKTYVEVVARCLHEEPKNRPTMAQVVLQLELALELQESKMPLVLHEIENVPAKIEQSANTGPQPTMANDDLLNVTHPPNDKPYSKLDNPEPRSGKHKQSREVERQCAKHKQSRFWPRAAFWNRANTYKETEPYRSDSKTASAATNHLSSLNMVGHGARVYKAMLSTGKGLEELRNEVLFFRSLEHYSLTQVYVNEKPLSTEELLLLQGCPKPPKKLRPGRYWYDKISGYWGKEGEKPWQLISPLLAVGDRIKENASNGNTNVLMNGREITKAELWILQAAGVNCQEYPWFWVQADGSLQHEGVNTVIARLWERKLVRMLCSALDLPFPSDTKNPGGEEINKDRDKVNSKNLEDSTTYKLLLVGCDQSGTSTIFKQFVRVYLGEKLPTDQIFGVLGPGSSVCFAESSKSAMLQLLNFSEAISIGPHQPENLIRILDIYEVLEDLMPDIATLYPDEAESCVRTECRDVLERLGECARTAFVEFENAVSSNVSSNAFPGGGVHPLTRYVMNYIKALMDYRRTLDIVLRDRDQEDDPVSVSPDASPTSEEEGNGSGSPCTSAMAVHFRFLISILESNLDGKSKLYKEESLQHLFLMNNIHYMAEKFKGSDLRTVLGDDWIRKPNWKFQQHAMNYERATWSSIVALFRDEGFQNPGSNSTSSRILKERLQSFYLSFEEVYKSQTGWSIPDPQLRDDLRISTSLKVIRAYCSYLGRHINHISVKHVKYTSDELEEYLLDLFEGSQKSLHGSHRK